MKKISLGFVGAGFVGQIAHISQYYQLKNQCQLTALCEARPSLLKAAQQAYGFGQSYKDLTSFLNQAKVDAVVAVTRRPHTFEVARQILKKQRALLTEKPMAHTVAQAQTLVKLAQKNKLVYCVGMMRRFDAGVLAAQKIIQQSLKNNRLGSLQQINFYCYGGESYWGAQPLVKVSSQNYPQNLVTAALAPTWLNKKHTQAYAHFVNVYSHTLNLARFLLNDEMAVRTVNIDHAKRSGSISFEFKKNKVLAGFNYGVIQSSRWHEVFTLGFERGLIQIALPPAFQKNSAAEVRVYSQRQSPRMLKPANLLAQPKWVFLKQAQEFIKAVKTRQRSVISAEESLADLQLIEAIWQKV